MMTIVLKKATVQTTAYNLVSFEHFLRKIIGQRISQSLFVVRGYGSLDAELLWLGFHLNLLLIDILQTMYSLLADYFGSLKKFLSTSVAKPHNFYAAPGKMRLRFLPYYIPKQLFQTHTELNIRVMTFTVFLQIFFI
jgi:hypothetical protein